MRTHTHTHTTFSNVSLFFLFFFSQPFFFFFLCVGTIIESLDAWVEGERMEGSNQLSCDFLPKGADGKSIKVNGMKRCCIGVLPNTMIIHLKRFGLNYQTFEMYKMNDLFQFPEILDMKKYTEKYLKKQDLKKDGGGGGGDGDDDDDGDGESKSVGSSSKSGDGMAGDDDDDDEDCTYR